MSTCPSCGSKTSQGAQFCDECGTALPAAPASSGPQRPPSAFCRKCGAALSPGSQFCGNCGTPPGPPPQRRHRWTVIIGLAVLGAIAVGAVGWLWWTRQGHQPKVKSYRIGQVQITAQVREDGSMHVQESREYVFSGAFHHAYRTMTLPPGMSIAGFTVSETATPYIEQSGESPNTYQVSVASGVFRADWYYQAADETRTFVLDYDIVGAVRKQADVAKLDWQFIGSEWESATDAVNVIVMLPGRIPRQRIQALVNGPLRGNVSISDGQVVFTCERLPAKTMLEGRILFPTEERASRITEVEVQALINRWLSAQNSHDFDEYATCYAADFYGLKRTIRGTTSRYDRNGWLADRRQMMSRARRLEVTTADRKISLGPGNLEATARFIQYYRSDRYSDKGPKTMRFRKDPATGAILIVCEELEWSERI